MPVPALTSRITTPTIQAMLSGEQNRQLSEVLLKAESRVLASAQQALELSREGSRDERGDSIDLSNQEELLSTALRLHDREKKLLDKIHEALDRLREETIDECETCGGEIAFKRLLARPVTTLCIECKESAEELERQRGGVGEAQPEWIKE